METNNYSEYIGALTAYYEQYNAAVGDVYVRLVKVRQQLAAALDYDSYADYSYDMTYGRDYTPEQGSAFLEGIRTHLLPVLNRANADLSLAWLDYDDASEESLRNMLESAAQNIGGTVFDAYRFMTAYDLCDIGKSPRKLEASFQTYLYDYEAPFVFLNSRGDSKDYTTFSHEFGHFTDSYYNYGANEDLETAETFSQAMEFLALTYTDTLSEKEKNTLLKKNLLDTLQTFVYQGAYADFESRVYALDPDEITLEKINDLYRQCCKDYGLYEQGFDFYYSQSWIDVLHFFEVPYYIISYCVSAETALQVYRLEAEEKGAGVAAYFRLLDRSYVAGVQQVMEGAKMESPFRDGVLEETAEFFTLKLGIK
jgi:oligoendopeptidase F